MSDHSISIVPKKSTYYDNKAKAQEILEWLISTDIVKPYNSDCILSDEKGHAVSNGAEKITDYPDSLPFFLTINGLEITTEKEVFHTGETGIEKCICPNCDKDISQEEWSFIDNWYSQDSDKSTCPLCNNLIDIHQLEIIPEWGFSNLGFTFWNWPELKKDFIEEFQERLNCEINVVYQHV